MICYRPLQAIIFLIVLFFTAAVATEAISFQNRCQRIGDHKQSVCLNMIVKDEKDVIVRCLKSVKPLIDYWVICDTGSTDGTQQIITEYMSDVPGELIERPWKNFEYNRNEALKLADDKAEYLLFIDADEFFEYEKGYNFPKLQQNCYYITTILNNALKYGRALIIKTGVGYQWKGVVHEGLYGPGPVCTEPLDGIFNIARPEGARSKDPKKFDKDIALLEEAVKENPADTRSFFYLAQSYRDSENYQKSIEVYQQRVALGGWDQELFWSLLQIAILQDILKYPFEEVVKSYYQAFQYRSTRAEPLYYLAKKYGAQDDFAAAYSVSKLAMMIPYPADILFVEKWVYEYGLMLENSIAAYWLGKYAESKALSERILLIQDLPDSVRTCVEKNLAFANEKLGLLAPVPAGPY